MQFSPARLRAFREEANLSRQALADAAGVSKSTIKRLENGYGPENFQLSTIAAIAVALGRDGSAFFVLPEGEEVA